MWLTFVMSLDVSSSWFCALFASSSWRYSPAMRSLLDALYAERRALMGCLVILLGAALFSAAVMHLVEGTVQPDQFGRFQTRCGGRSLH